MSTDPDPNPWSLQRDDAKILITLGTAVLGVSATFGKNLLAPNGSAPSALLGAWLAIAASIVAAILASARVFSRLKNGGHQPGGIASFWLNASFFLLVGGLVSIAFVAYFNWNNNSSISESQSVITAEQFVAQAQGTASSELTVRRFSQLDDSNVLVVIVDPPARVTFLVVVDRSDGQVIHLSRTN